MLIYMCVYVCIQLNEPFHIDTQGYDMAGRVFYLFLIGQMPIVSNREVRMLHMNLWLHKKMLQCICDRYLSWACSWFVWLVFSLFHAPALQCALSIVVFT